MDFLRKYLGQIRGMLANLSVPARLLMAVLALVVVVSVAMMFGWAGKPQKVAVFSAPLSAEEIGHAQMILRSGQMDAEVKDGLLYVPADRREEAISQLAYENILPAESISAFEDMARKESMFRTEKQDEEIWKQVKQTVLSRLIGRFPGVKQATVMIEPGSAQRLGTPGTPPTASVNLTLKSDASMNSKLRASIADLVAGAVPRMKREDVRIVDATNGRSYRVAEEEDLGNDRLEKLAAVETYYNKKLQEHLRFIPDVIISVHAVPDPMQQERKVDETYREPVSGVTNSTNQSSTGGAATAAEPGATANIGNISIASLGGNGANQESTEDKSEVRFPTTKTETVSNGGVVKEISASVDVPRDYLVKMCNALSGSTQTPSDSDLEPHLKRIQEQVMNAIGVKEPELVKVDWYVAQTAATATAPTQAGVGTALFSYGKPAALGVLSLIALVMVMSFVRRRAPVGPAVETSNLGGLLDTPVGVASSEEGALPGIELDDETVRSQKIVEQVAQMVKKNPDSATNLIRRWVQQK